MKIADNSKGYWVYIFVKVINIYCVDVVAGVGGKEWWPSLKRIPPSARSLISEMRRCVFLSFEATTTPSQPLYLLEDRIIRKHLHQDRDFGPQLKASYG